MDRLRFSEHVPPMRDADARALRDLPSAWESAIDESAVDGLLARGEGLASALAASGRSREAAALRRRVALLERADELYRHASRIETLAQLYRAMESLRGADVDAALEEAITWVQAGALRGEDSPLHGPAFRATASLRNRAFRLLEAETTTLSRAGGRR